jgi:1-acyl-sn-glycerol-3-phosphate acyltransferase
VRVLRWTRLALHAAHAALVLRFVYPRAVPARRRELVQWWSAKLLRILNVTPHVEGEPPQPGAAAVMVAANHVSWIDIFLICAVRPTRFVAKSEIRAWPIAGWIADRAGTLFIRRDQMRDMARIDARVRQVMGEGDCVGLFPEGITTEGDELRKFHSSLFEPAVANAAHVHPIAIRYEHPDGTLCRQMSFIGDRTFGESIGLIVRQEAVRARLMFAPPIETAGASRRDVAKSVEGEIARLLELAPAAAGTGPRTRFDR